MIMTCSFLNKHECSLTTPDSTHLESDELDNSG